MSTEMKTHGYDGMATTMTAEHLPVLKICGAHGMIAIMVDNVGEIVIHCCLLSLPVPFAAGDDNADDGKTCEDVPEADAEADDIKGIYDQV